MERPLSEAVSEWIVEDFKLKWVVKNFRYIKCEYNQCVTSPELQINISGDCTKWKIKLYPNGYEKEESVAVFLVLIGTKFVYLMVDCELVLLNVEGEQMQSQEFGVPVPFTAGYSFGFHDFSTRDALMQNISKTHTLTFIFNLKVSYDVKNCYTPITNHQSSIIDDLAKLRQDADFSDIIIMASGREFRAHKNILAARSPVFSSMLKLNMKETNSGKIEIEDITAEAFEEFLKFIYTGNANIDEYASELFVAADKYDIQDLKAFCEDTLIEKITKENYLETLILSDFHSSKKLKEKTMNFIISNNIKTDKNELAKIKNPSLMLELVEAFMNNRS